MTTNLLSVIEQQQKALEQARDALESIALAGMSGSGQESEEAMTDWHARRAWEFIGIAARALDPLRAAISQLDEAPGIGPAATWKTRIFEGQHTMTHPTDPRALVIGALTTFAEYFKKRVDDAVENNFGYMPTDEWVHQFLDFQRSAEDGLKAAQKLLEQCTDERMCVACFTGQGKCETAHPQASEQAPSTAGEREALPMDTAPTDGTMIRLLVDFEGNSLEDTDQPVWTIGACYASDSEGDVWQFAGWNWSHDRFTEGHGVPIGWLPMIDTTQPADKLVEQLNSDEVEELIHLCKHAGHDVDDFEGECPACTARVKLEALSAAKAAQTERVEPLPLLVRDIAADLGTTSVQVCEALRLMGLGGYSVNMAVTPEMSRKLTDWFARTPPTEPPQAVPEGMKMVPIEPTREMLIAGVPEKSTYGLNYAEACYRAMLAASPKIGGI